VGRGKNKSIILVVRNPQVVLSLMISGIEKQQGGMRELAEGTRSKEVAREHPHRSGDGAG